MLQRILPDLRSSPLAEQMFADHLLIAARENFWQYRILLNPRFILDNKWFPQLMAKKLRRFWDQLRAGKRPILLLQTPPQHGKSLSVIDFIAWAVGHDPELRVIYASFSDRLGIRANLRLQRALANPLYQQLFPGTRISESATGRYLRNHEVLEFVDHEGSFRNTTVLGSITGEALDLGVIDDPIKGREEADSQLKRDKAWAWLTDDVFSRFSDGAGLLLVMTRWHLDDPAGRLMEHFGDRVTVVRFPAIAEHDEKHRRMGDPLFPELKSLEYLQQRRQLYTQASWESLYQQNPIVVGGGIFPISKISVIPERPAESQVLSVARYWDKAGCLLAGTSITKIGRAHV